MQLMLMRLGFAVVAHETGRHTKKGTKVMFVTEICYWSTC